MAAAACIRLTDRYVLCGELGSGGMASVHVGRLLGSAAFARTVAIKRLHARFAEEPDLRLMLVDEAHLAARVRHPNVVQVLDALSAGDELFLVMEYVDGVSLGQLRAREPRVAEPMVAAVLRQVLDGLHAAHEATDEAGAPLAIVHRDVSPENILVGADGFARVLDFGIAKARSRLHTTRTGEIKGRLSYMAPEQLSGHATRASDVFAASIVLWECLAGRPLFLGDDDGETIGRVLATVVEPPSATPLAAVAMRGLARDPAERWPTAHAMARAIETAAAQASAAEVAAWVEQLGGSGLARRRALVREVEAMALESPRAEPGEPVPRAIAAHDLEADGGYTLADSPHARALLARPRRRRRIALAAGAAAMVAIATIVIALAIARSSDDGDGDDVLVLPTPAASSHDASAIVPAPPVVEAGAPRPAPSGPVGHARALHAHAPPPATSKATSCDPPYRLGPLGEKVWLKSCL
ncbi:MAG TPA: serine/threonine-protein kinase [Kofleriaceae bacterium]